MQTQKTNRVLIVIAVIAAVSLVVFAISFFWVSKRSSDYIKPRRGDITEAIYGLGKVKSHRQFEVKVGITTQMQKLYVREGQKVKKGDRLVKFTDGNAFRAPFDGTVTNIVFHESETVPPNTNTLSIEDLTDKYIEVSLEQEGALRVRPGQKVKVVFESIRNEIFEGQVSAVFPKSGEFLAHIAVDGLGASILPGMSADVSIVVGRQQNVLLIPLSAITNGQVMRRRDGRREKVKVKIGGIDGEWAEVTDDSVLATDEILVKSQR